MKYIISKGTETFNKLTALHQRMQDCEEAAYQLQKELGGTSRMVYRTVAGGMHGVALPGKPEGWRYATNDNYDGFFYPKKIKANKELIERIKNLPVVEHKDVNEVVGFEFQSSGLKWFNRPAVAWGKEYCLIEVDDECYFTPNKDMVEILGSEYKMLMDRLEEERKKDED